MHPLEGEGGSIKSGNKEWDEVTEKRRREKGRRKRKEKVVEDKTRIDFYFS